MLSKWNPLNIGIARSPSLMPSFNDLFRQADTLLESALIADRVLPAGAALPGLTPDAEVVEAADEIRVTVDLPGHDPSGLDVKLEGDILTVRSERKQELPQGRHTHLLAERGYGIFARSFVLPSTVDAARCEARLENGVLTVILPKREEARPRSIEVKVQT